MHPPERGLERAREVVRRLALALQTLGTSGPTHPDFAIATDELHDALEPIELPLVLRFAGDAVFSGHALLPLDPDDHDRARQVAAALEAFGAHELGVHALPAPETLRALAAWLVDGPDPLAAFDLPGIQLRSIPGRAAAVADPDTDGAIQLTLAHGRAEALARAAADAWDWSEGLTVVRRLEAGIALSPDAMARALEIAPGEWTPSRRATSATFRFLSIADRLRLPEGLARAAAHGVLVLASTGYGSDGGPEVPRAAARALPRLLADPRLRDAYLPPHRVRVCSLVAALAEPVQPDEPAETWTGVPGLVRLVYELDRDRRPDGAPCALTYGDLLARAIEGMGERFDPWCVRALSLATGAMPPGTPVRTADGKTGVVLDGGDGDDPFRPRLLVGDRVLIPDRGVVFLSPRSRG